MKKVCNFIKNIIVFIENETQFFKNNASKIRQNPYISYIFFI